MSDTATATRTTTARARSHFANGGRVCVSVDGAATFPVGPSTVTHDRTHTTWTNLAAAVTSYGDKRQRFYVVTDADTYAPPPVDRRRAVRDWWVDGHYLTADTADDARAEASQLYAFTPEHVRPWTAADQLELDARHDD